VFAYEFGERPRTMSVADHRGGRFLRDVADAYSRFFHVLDGNHEIVSESKAMSLGTSVMLHRQGSDEIHHEAYRAACYSQPNVSERASLLVQPAEHVWLSVNLYRDRAHGNFTPGEIQHIEKIAHVLAHAAKHHYLISGQHEQGVSNLMLARVRRSCPDLSKRELDVLRGVLEGLTAAEIAEQMGIKASSVVTYQKRAYARLGISSQRQLFALCLSNQA
jgi:DNA-binding CsgD family transcriptional regulator